MQAFAGMYKGNVAKLKQKKKKCLTECCNKNEIDRKKHKLNKFNPIILVKMCILEGLTTDNQI